MAGATIAVRAWINASKDLVGKGKPLGHGAYLTQERSPASGAYAVLQREMGSSQDLCAEPGGPAVTRITAHVYAGTITAAEAAAEALDAAWRLLTVPTAAGDTGVVILTAANFSAPGLVPPAGEGGEVYEYQTSADFILYQPLRAYCQVRPRMALFIVLRATPDSRASAVRLGTPADRLRPPVIARPAGAMAALLADFAHYQP